MPDCIFSYRISSVDGVYDWLPCRYMLLFCPVLKQPALRCFCAAFVCSIDCTLLFEEEMSDRTSLSTGRVTSREIANQREVSPRKRILRTYRKEIAACTHLIRDDRGDDWRLSDHAWSTLHALADTGAPEEQTFQAINIATPGGRLESNKLLRAKSWEPNATHSKCLF